MTEKYCIENDFAAQKELAETEQHSSMLIWEENKALRARVSRLEDALRFILDECDWEPTHHESGGDERIGAVARRALEEK